MHVGKQSISISGSFGGQMFFFSSLSLFFQKCHFVLNSIGWRCCLWHVLPETYLRSALCNRFNFLIATSTCQNMEVIKDVFRLYVLRSGQRTSTFKISSFQAHCNPLWIISSLNKMISGGPWDIYIFFCAWVSSTHYRWWKVLFMWCQKPSQ